MKSFYVVETKTKDGLLHQGLYSEPLKKQSRAVLWIHGLSATFYNDICLYETMAETCEKEGWGLAIFNNRGHDLIAGIRKYDGSSPNGYSYFPGGAGCEIFSESILDIEAGVNFLVGQGFSEVVIVGHSTGANKTCYYGATQKNSHVIGIVLSGPLSDRLNSEVSQEKRTKDLARMYQLVAEGKGDALFFGYHFFPITPKRYISLFEAGSTEDTFDYGEHKPKMTYFSQIQLPLMVLLPGADEYADRPIDDIQKVFDEYARSDRYQSVIIADAQHKLHGKEQEAATVIVKWIKTI